MVSKTGMGIDGVTEPIYFLITAIGFVIISFINYRKNGKTLETKVSFWFSCFLYSLFHHFKFLLILTNASQF
jgi:hypothetical protein